MADRDGLGDLPLFDTEVRPVREFVSTGTEAGRRLSVYYENVFCTGQTDSGSDRRYLWSDGIRGQQDVWWIYGSNDAACYGG